MAIFKLKTTGGDIAKAELVEASKTSLDLEAHLESWLEHSPWAIAQEALLVIGRQTSSAGALARRSLTLLVVLMVPRLGAVDEATSSIRKARSASSDQLTQRRVLGISKKIFRCTESRHLDRRVRLPIVRDRPEHGGHVRGLRRMTGSPDR